MTDPYWALYEATLNRIENEKPNTVDALKEILDTFQDPSAGDAFFPDGGDRSLSESLAKAGWEFTWYKAYYHYGMRHRATGERLRYVEGDIYRGK